MFTANLLSRHFRDAARREGFSLRLLGWEPAAGGGVRVTEIRRVGRWVTRPNYTERVGVFDAAARLVDLAESQF